MPEVVLNSLDLLQNKSCTLQASTRYFAAGQLCRKTEISSLVSVVVAGRSPPTCTKVERPSASSKSLYRAAPGTAVQENRSCFVLNSMLKIGSGSGLHPELRIATAPRLTARAAFTILRRRKQTTRFDIIP
jgi:hypothetical protein